MKRCDLARFLFTIFPSQGGQNPDVRIVESPSPVAAESCPISLTELDSTPHKFLSKAFAPAGIIQADIKSHQILTIQHTVGSGFLALLLICGYISTYYLPTKFTLDKKAMRCDYRRHYRVISPGHMMRIYGS